MSALHQEQRKDNGENAADTDGQTAHSAFSLAQLQSPGSAHGVGTGADGQAGGHRVLDTEGLDEHGGQDTAQDAGEDNGHHSDGLDTAQVLRDADSDGSGHRLGDQRGGDGLVKPEQAAHEIDAAHGGNGTGGAAHQNRQPVFPEQIDLRIDGHRQTGCGGGEEHVDDGAALVIGRIGNAAHQQYSGHQDDGDEQGIAQHQSGLFLDADADPEGDHAQGDAKKRRGKEFRHYFFLRFIRYLVRRTV